MVKEPEVLLLGIKKPKLPSLPHSYTRTSGQGPNHGTGQTCYSCTSGPGPAQFSPCSLAPRPFCTSRSVGLQNGVTLQKRPRFLSHILKEKKPKQHQHVALERSKLTPSASENWDLLMHFLLNTWTNISALKENVITLFINGKTSVFLIYIRINM